MIDAARILQETFVADVEVHEELPSTNDRAVQAAGRVQSLPHLIIAARQTRGRGRGAHRWWSSAGALTFSLIIELDETSLPRRRWPQVSLAAGAGVCAGIERVTDRDDVRLKWPNDVFLAEKKVCGVLVELPPAHPRRLVIGVGVNVNNSQRDAPAELRGRSIALVDVLDRPLDLTDCLAAVLSGIDTEIRAVSTGDAGSASRWRRRCLLTGRSVTIHDGTRSISGTCQGIQDDGALLLLTAAGPQLFYGGVVTEFW